MAAIDQNQQVEGNPELEPFWRLWTNARKSAGYPTARAFWKDFHKVPMEMSYSNYTRIESGMILPSIQIFLKLSHFLKVQNFSGLLKSFLQAHSEDQETAEFINQNLSEGLDNSPKVFLDNAVKAHRERKQILSHFQMSGITQDPHTYIAFLLISLNRAPISSTKLRANLRLSQKEVGITLSKLKELKLIRESSKGYRSIYPHIGFPKGYRPALQHLNRQALQVLGPPKNQRTIFLKTSDRMASLFKLHAQKLGDSFAAFEEPNPEANEELYVFQYSLHSTKEQD